MGLLTDVKRCEHISISNTKSTYIQRSLVNIKAKVICFQNGRN